MQESKIPKMMTIKEASKISGVAMYRIRALALQNKITHLRAGKKILINIDRFIDFLNCAPNGVGTMAGTLNPVNL